MSTVSKSYAPHLAELLARLKRQIWAYVLADGILLAVAWLIVSFWIAFAVDFLPVTVGSTEMPRPARAVVLALILVGLGIICHRAIVRRLLFRLRDRQLALLIERRHPELQERLLTSVDVITADGDLGTRMLQRIRDQVQQLLGTIQLPRVFNFAPLVRRALLAIVLIGTVVPVAIWRGELLTLAVRRLYLLDDQPYPRRTHLELLGFTNGERTVARGSQVTIRVRADATRRTPPPHVCTISYRLADGSRGRVNMSKEGVPQDGFQEYTYDGKPFNSLLDEVVFDIRGNDFTLRQQRVRVVDSPQIVAAQIRMVLPPYTGLLPREVPYRPGLPVPIGSEIRLTVRANKSLVAATMVAAADDAPTRQLQPTATDGQTLVIELPAVIADIQLDLTLMDSDGIASLEPYPIQLATLPDRLPEVDVQLKGIGTAVTTMARIPLEGKIEDDYGLKSISVIVQQTGRPDFHLEVGGTETNPFRAELDLRELGQRGELTLSEGTRLAVGIQATDHYDLTSESRVGEGDRYDLDVVRPEELLSLLEARELGLRQRFEQIVDEMQQMRDSLARAAMPAETAGTGGDEPGESAESVVIEDEPTGGGLQLLRIQRAIQHVDRATLEVLGVAFAFQDIREELINNRVDTPERVRRLGEDIAQPLQAIADLTMRQLGETLAGFEQSCRGDADLAVRQQRGQASLQQTDEVILAMEQVLAKMLDLESYNELLEIVRSLIRDQEVLEERTREEQRRQALELLK